MKLKINWTKIGFDAGVIALLIGTIDPLEGSIVISIGSILVGFLSYLSRDKYWKFFFAFTLMIIFGVGAMFYLSSLGGFGGESSLKWFWGLFIITYPIGWLSTIILLIVRWRNK